MPPLDQFSKANKAANELQRRGADAQGAHVTLMLLEGKAGAECSSGDGKIPLREILMILKSADDKSKRLALLKDLQQSTLLDDVQRTWLNKELDRLNRGIQGERDSAHYLDNYFRNGENHVVLHDLRFVVDREIAQIDHLVINRMVGVYLIETKNFGGNLHINEHGEFTAEYGNLRFGIESPIEQSHRHERILVRLLERLDIVGRMQKRPNFHHVVMLHPKAIIQRPPIEKFDTTCVIKADQFPSWHERYVGAMGAGVILKSVLNLRSLDTLKEWGEMLRRQHRPSDLLALPDFMKPKPAVAAQPPVDTSAAAAPVAQEHLKRRLICARCGEKISFDEGKFCWNRSARFGGLQYCREHQKAF